VTDIDAAGQAQGPSGSWPSITVVVPTHERPELLRRTVEAIVGQRYPGSIECLVVFDREEPHHPCIELPPGRRLDVRINNRTPGPAGAMNAGVLAASGELLAFCNDDDEWFPDKLRLQVEALDRFEAGLGVCGIYLTDGRSFGRRFVRMSKKQLLRMEDLLRASRHEVHTSTWVVRRSLLDQIGLIDEGIPGSYGEDYDWLLRAAKVTPIVSVRRPLVWVRWQHSFFREKWQTMIEGLEYQLERRPELHMDSRNLSRVYGRLAFAYAAVGKMRAARSVARRCLTLRPAQLRGYVAILVSYRLLRPQTVLRVLSFMGRGF
jgi:glycosyltransferase involved in cell wall biosynthesis